MKKLLPYLFLFVLLACQKEKDEPIPQLEDCLLTETVTNGTIRKFTFDNQNRVTRTESYLNGTMSGSEEFDYNSRGLVETQYFYNAQSMPTGYDTFIYNENDLLVEHQNHVLSNGTEFMRTRSIYEYASPTELAMCTTFAQNGTATHRFFEYENGVMRRMLYFEASGRHFATVELEHDGKLNPYQTIPALQKNNPSGIGFPYTHNLTKVSTVWALDARPILMDYTATFEYNSTGLPVKRTISYKDGKVTNVGYTYQCQPEK